MYTLQSTQVRQWYPVLPHVLHQWGSHHMWLLSIDSFMYTMHPLTVACNAHRRFQAVPGVEGSEWSQLIYNPSLGLHCSAVWVDPFIKTLIKWLMFLPSLHSGCSSGVCCHLAGVLCHLYQAAQASSQRGRGSPVVEPPPALSVCVYTFVTFLTAPILG